MKNRGKDHSKKSLTRSYMAKKYVRPIKCLKLGIYIYRSYKSYRSYMNLISYTREYIGMRERSPYNI